METGIQKYLNSALAVLNKVGIDLTKREESRLVQILDTVKHVDEPKVLAIAQTVRYMGSFNELVRENVSEMRVADRYNRITEMFDSVREDTKTMIKQLDDNKIGFGEKVQNIWMRLARGSIHDRFEKIRKTYLEVSEDTKNQLESEDEVMNAYIDFRFALKEAEAITNELFKIQETKLDSAKSTLAETTSTLEKYSGNDSAEKSRFQLKRDEAKIAFDREERTYQLFKDITEDLSNSYNVGEAIIAKLKQDHDLKDQIYKRAISFFTMNENVFTTLDLAYTTQKGLYESTQTLESMKEGVSKGIEDIVEIGGKIEKAALKAGYGSTYKIESVKKLVDAIVNYQKTSREDIEKYREESTKTAEEIAKIVDEGKKKCTEIITKYSEAA